MDVTHTYTRYLAAKKTVDDRALNHHVMSVLRSEIAAHTFPLRVLEVGAGLGTMVGRLIERGVLKQAEYLLLDVDQQSLADSSTWLERWAVETGRIAERTDEDVISIRDEQGVNVQVRTVCAELGEFVANRSGVGVADLLIANAFLDLVDVRAMLPGLFRLVVPGGLYWFSINFDGETIFQPDDDRDAPLLEVYHRSMDERVRYGRPAGDSRSGRHLFNHLLAAEATVLAAGSSDWVVHSHEGRYPSDEAYFVEHILHTISEELNWRSEINQDDFTSWLGKRRAQLATGELVYIAHQLDFAGRVPGPSPR